jgi:hypothetical protein
MIDFRSFTAASIAGTTVSGRLLPASEAATCDTAFALVTPAGSATMFLRALTPKFVAVLKFAAPIELTFSPYGSFNASTFSVPPG